MKQKKNMLQMQLQQLTEGRHGRPKFVISEKQLCFFKGFYNAVCEYIYTCKQNINYTQIVHDEFPSLYRVYKKDL